MDLELPRRLILDAEKASYAFAIALLCVWLALILLRNRQILDHPNSRSSHTLPTPRGGGIGFIPVILIFQLPFLISLPLATSIPLALAPVLVAAISFADDMKSVALPYRLVTHALAVTLMLNVLPEQLRLAPDWMPLLAERAIIGLGWVWFINLFNFMDGIDGLAGSEALAISVGVVALAGFGPWDFFWPSQYAAPIAGAVAAFLMFNLPPAKLFMGDVGSVTLGFLLGYVLIVLAHMGGLAAAIVLPLYFCVDATVTLVRRALRGAKLGEAHRDHAYQQAVDRGASHGKVVFIITLLNVALIALAVWSLSQPVLALATGAALTIACYLALLHKVGGQAGNGASSPS